MSEAGDVHGAQHREQDGSAPRTGHPAIDAVLSTVAGLAGRPLIEHPAVFEAAQEQLRHSLDVPDQGR